MELLQEGIAEPITLSLGQVIIVVRVFVTRLFIPLGEKIGLGSLLNALIIGNTVDLILWLFDDRTALAGRIVLLV